MTAATNTTDSSPAAPATRRRGRPRKVDDAKRRKICVLVSIGYDLRQAAQMAGCSYPTIRRETLRHPDFQNRLRQAMKLKSEINAQRDFDRQLDHTISQLRQKLCIAPDNPLDAQ
jgi:hypothetical protein